MLESESGTPPRRRGRPPGPATIRYRALRAARQVFGEYGYDATTFEIIAGRLGVTRPALSYHFGTKRKLYGEVLASTRALLRAVTEHALTAPNLRAQLRYFLDTVSADEGLAAFLVSASAELRRHPQRWPAEHDPLELVRKFVSAAIRDAMRRGEIAAGAMTMSATDMFVATIMGQLFYAGFIGDEPLEDVFADFAALLDGTVMARAHNSATHGSDYGVP